MKELRIVTPDDVETLQIPWGVFQWMNRPGVTGSSRLTTGVGEIAPGFGHARHCHPDMEEVLYFMSGECEQMLEAEDGTQTKQIIHGGDLVHLPAGMYHSTINIGKTNARFLAIYEHNGPEEDMRSDPDAKITPPRNQSIS